MADDTEGRIRSAEIVLPCEQLDETVGFFTETLGFRVEAVFPADEPSVAVISGHGLRIRLQRGGGGSPGELRLACSEPAALAGGATELVAPNGTRIELVDAEPAIALPPLVSSLVVTRRDDSDWKVGRAGMLYRDLVPDRQGGRVVASHIRIPNGGDVPDYVHYHRVHFQLIHCVRGWVRVVYEDQGPPFVLNAGDCVLQAPGIRHRVLEASPGLEVVEVTCPAEHETLADHDLVLPTSTRRPEREFGGQRFLRHEAAGATWGPWRLAGFEARDTGVARATDGLAGAVVVRPAGPGSGRGVIHDAELLFVFVLNGAVTLRCRGREAERIEVGGSFVVPAGIEHAIEECTEDAELFEVTTPAAFETITPGA